MDPTAFKAPKAGRVIRTPRGYAAFVPAPLPPTRSAARRNRGLRHVSRGPVAARAATSDIVTTLAARYVLHERVTPTRWAGVEIVSLGIALISAS